MPITYLDDEAPQGKISYIDEPAQPSFAGQMWENLKGAGQAASDLVSKDYWGGFGSKLSEGASDIAEYATNPQLRRDVGAAGFERNDYQKALLQGFSDNPAGKALSVMGGVIPAWNAAGAAVTKYGIPAITDNTQLTAEDVQLGLLGAPFVVKGATKLPVVGSAINTGVQKATNVPFQTIAKAGNALLDSPTVGKFVSSTTRSRPEILSAEQFRAKANESYSKAAEKGLIADETLSNNFVKFIDESKPKPLGKDADGKNVYTSEQLDIINALDEYSGLKNNKLSLEGIQNIDRTLGAKIERYVDPVTGKMKDTGRQLLEIQNKFRNMIDELPESNVINGKEAIQYWKEGREYWKQQAKMADIERILTRAEYSDNPTTIIKNGFKNLITNDKKLRGYTKEEIRLIQKAAKTGVVTRGLKLASSGLVPIGVAIAGGGLVGAPIAFGLGRAAAAGAEAMQKAPVNKLQQAITNRNKAEVPIRTLRQQLPKVRIE